MGRIKNKMFSAAHSFFNVILDFIYPPFCYLCDNKLETKEEFFCKICWNKQKKIKDIYLHAEKMPYIPGPVKWISGSFACFEYSEITQEFIHFFKYKKFNELSNTFAAELADVLENAVTNIQFDLLASVPLHKKRLKERGFNQAELIAKSLSEKINIPYSSNTLVRPRYTKPQAKMSREERIKNVKDAFRLGDSQLLKSKIVLLIDDVLTTGSTMNECARLLRLGGAKEVYSLTITRI